MQIIVYGLKNILLFLLKKLYCAISDMLPNHIANLVMRKEVSNRRKAVSVLPQRNKRKTCLEIVHRLS